MKRTAVLASLLATVILSLSLASPASAETVVDARVGRAAGRAPAGALRPGVPRGHEGRPEQCPP